jgi:hypothetical protein
MHDEIEQDLALILVDRPNSGDIVVLIRDPIAGTKR